MTLKNAMNAMKTIFLTQMATATIARPTIVMNVQMEKLMEIKMSAQIVQKSMDLMSLLLIVLLASLAKYKIVHNAIKIIETVQVV